MDDNSMSERILRTIESILHNDPDLQEFIIIPAELNTKNKSPVLYEEHNIGLESWCVKHIYRYAYLELFKARKQSRKKLALRHINHFLIGVLLINPDVYSFWNMKRELVENDVLSVQTELNFSRLVLTYKSKSNEAFAYRRWLLRRVLQKNCHNDTSLLNSELNLTLLCAERNSNNYHSWTHRIWCIENLNVDNFSDFLFQELDFSQKWISQHVSEHTGFHYRQYLINLIQKRKISCVYNFYYKETIQILNLVDSEPSNTITYLLGSQQHSVEQTITFVNCFSLLLYELYFMLEALNSMFPNHETLYYHRRFLVWNLMKTAHEYHGLEFNSTNVISGDGEKQPKLFKCQPSKVESSILYQNLVKSESEFVRNSLSKSSDFYGCGELVKRYERWLKNFIFKDGS